MSRISQSKMSAAKPLVLDKEQKEELKEAFDLFDSNGDGKIAARELQVVLQAIGRNMDLREVEMNIV